MSLPFVLKNNDYAAIKSHNNFKSSTKKFEFCANGSHSLERVSNNARLLPLTILVNL